MIKRRKNKRGFEKLRVMNDAVTLYAETCKVYTRTASELNKVALKGIAAAQNIFSNISEGYCRTGSTDYLQSLNIALASSVELHSCLLSSLLAGQITEGQFNALNQILYRTENQLFKLIESLQGNSKQKKWDSTSAKHTKWASQSKIPISEYSY